MPQYADANNEFSFGMRQKFFYLILPKKLFASEKQKHKHALLKFAIQMLKKCMDTGEKPTWRMVDLPLGSVEYLAPKCKMGSNVVGASR